MKAAALGHRFGAPVHPWVGWRSQSSMCWGYTLRGSLVGWGCPKGSWGGEAVQVGWDPPGWCSGSRGAGGRGNLGIYWAGTTLSLSPAIWTAVCLAFWVFSVLFFCPSSLAQYWINQLEFGFSLAVPCRENTIYMIEEDRILRPIKPQRWLLFSISNHLKSGKVQNTWFWKLPFIDNFQ